MREDQGQVADASGFRTVVRMREAVPGAYNRKSPFPSDAMLPSEGRRYRCAWINDSITIHSDGNVTCGLDDPHAQRSFGNIYRDRVEDIFANPEYERLQANLAAGHRCSDCQLYEDITDAPDAIASSRAVLPDTLIVEPTIKCNIRCLNGDACTPNNDPDIVTRDASMLDPEALVDVLGQLRDTLKQVYFFNYGDPFVHPGAEDMLLQIARICPGAKVITSTNGIPLYKPGRAIKVVRAGLDQIVFTIGGVTQESYSRYHVGGRYDRAIRGLMNVAAAKRELGLSRPKITWRYLLFNWNDSDAEIAHAMALAKEIGVDEFILYLTPIPVGGASFRFAPGSPNFAKHRDIIDSALNFSETAGVPAPDADGFHKYDEVTGLGLCQWTSWSAVRRFDLNGKWINFSLTTNRPVSRERPCVAYVVTPWRSFRVPLEYMKWRDIAILVPDGERSRGSVDVVIATPDYWFPADETTSTDPRCLGVLYRDLPAFSDRDEEMLCAIETRLLPQVTGAELSAIGPVEKQHQAGLAAGNAGRFDFSNL